MITFRSLVKIIEAPQIIDECLLIFAQNPQQIPFKVKRFYLIQDVEMEKPRGFHAHIKNRQILFCIRGSVKIVLDDGKKRESVILNKPNRGVILENLVWHEMHQFKKNTVLLILASHIYDPGDYIRDYHQFLEVIKNES